MTPIENISQGEVSLYYQHPSSPVSHAYSLLPITAHSIPKFYSRQTRT